MTNYQSIGLSLRPERLHLIDARAEKLGLTRSKYFQTLVDADLDVGLLDCILDAKDGAPVVKVREGVSIVLLDKKAVESMGVGIIVQAMKTLGNLHPDLKAGALVGNVRKMAERVVKQ